ncbi:MAG TPA: UPF0175 family protein [Schlesneria sp.]|jgi:predicted HTH domain antitoxin
MAITFELPAEVEERLRAETPNLDAAAKEAVLVELYRAEKLSHYELSQLLGLSRFETDGLLKRHHVTEDQPTNEELEEDLRQARLLLGR